VSRAARPRRGPPTLPLDAEGIARRLEEVAALLERQRANPFRIRAYRRAAETVRGLDRPVHEILEAEGLAGLTALPGIGAALASAIEEIAFTDRLDLLDRLHGEASGLDLFTTVPGVGRELARRIHETLGIESLAELEAAANDGRLARVPGFGRGRVQAVRESLAGRFRRHPRAPESGRRPAAAEPPVAELLDVDREYREKAERDELPRVAPRRFNPEGAAWLPVLHTRRGERHYTAFFSNTARAHELGATRDWVVIYRDDSASDGQWTVVTEHSGELRGERVVRGREQECEELARGES
jgi:hypothetical protein